MPFADIATGARLFYDQAIPENPNGETVIAIHGRLGTGRTHLSTVMDWMSGMGCRVIAPTMRGYGQSTPKPRDFPPNFYHRDAEDTLALMDVLDITKAHILGYSDGGEIALICAGMQPERFQSATVWGAVGYFGPAMRAGVQRSYPADWITDEDKELHGITDADAFALGWITSVKRMIDLGGDVSVGLATRITCPVLMLLGDEDILNPAEYARVFLEKVRDGRLEVLKCGHAVHEEQWESFQFILGSFLAQGR